MVEIGRYGVISSRQAAAGYAILIHIACSHTKPHHKNSQRKTWLTQNPSGPTGTCTYSRMYRWAPPLYDVGQTWCGLLLKGGLDPVPT